MYIGHADEEGDFLLIGLNKNEEMITAERNLCKKDSYYCPSCKDRVCLKVGRVKQPHFAHYRNEACHAFSEGETAEHLAGKIQLATYLKMSETNVQLEAYLPHLKQRPDILFEKDNRKIAIEFQCSPISIKRVAERTQGYLTANYEVIWILGNHFKYTNKLTAFQKACLYPSLDKERLMLIHYEACIDRVSMRYDFELLSSGKMSFQLKQQNLNEKQSIKLADQKKFKVNEKNFNDIRSKHEQLLREVRYPNPKMQAFLELIYQNRENVVSIPKEIYQCMPRDWIIQSHPMNWKYQFILWLESFPKKKILTMKMLKLWVNKQVRAQLLVYYENPQITEEVILYPFLELIELLEKNRTLKKIGHLKWSYQRPLKRYKTLEEKFENEFS